MEPVSKPIQPTFHDEEVNNSTEPQPASQSLSWGIIMGVGSILGSILSFPYAIITSSIHQTVQDDSIAVPAQQSLKTQSENLTPVQNQLIIPSNAKPVKIATNDINQENHPLIITGKSVNWRNTFIHVRILNELTYVLNEKTITLRPPTFPEKVERNLAIDYKDLIADVKKLVEVFPKKETMEIQLKDLTTDQAIAEASGHIIALNFANERQIGGGPNIYRDNQSGKIVWGGGGSALAQEEALVSKSDLYSSLSLLPSTPKMAGSMIRSHYNDPFDSKIMAYVSDNQLFGIQGDEGFFSTIFLDKPIDVSFITSAAKYFGNSVMADTAEGSVDYTDAEARIGTHVYAIAKKAALMRIKDPEKRITLVLGAFGCGAFAPSNAEKHATMTATIIKKKLTHLIGFADEVILAIPKKALNNSPVAVRNYNAFAEVFNS